MLFEAILMSMREVVKVMRNYSRSKKRTLTCDWSMSFFYYSLELVFVDELVEVVVLELEATLDDELLCNSR